MNIDLNAVGQQIMEWLPGAGIMLGKFLLVVVVGYIVEKIVMYLLRKVLYKTKMDIAVISFVLSLTRIALKVAVVILALGALNLDVTALTASLGMFGVALSVALKDTLSSIANGLNIIVNKPFKNGDFVEIGSYSGTVVGIKIMSTELITPDNKTVVIPNNMVNTSALVNYSTQENRRIDIDMEVAYGTDVELVKDAMYEVVDANKKVKPYPGIQILLDSYGSSAIKFKARFWVNTEDYWDVYWSVKEEMVKGFNKYGIQIPFSQLDVHLNPVVEENTDGTRPPQRPLEPPMPPVVEEAEKISHLKKLDSILNDKFSKKVEKEEAKREKKLAKLQKKQDKKLEKQGKPLSETKVDVNMEVDRDDEEE